MKLYQLKVFTSLYALTVFGQDVSSCPRGQLCLTSFKQCDNQQQKGCREPTGSYPWLPPEQSAQLPALLGGTNYTISWVFGPGVQIDIPVRIQWQMYSVVWETNTTASGYIFNPGRLLQSFPTPQAPNLTREMAWFNASQYNGSMLIISQPEAVGMGENFPIALSQHFTVQPDIVGDYIKTQIGISRQTEFNKWRLGVSIGLGIGIPFLAVATTLGVLGVMKMKAMNQMGEDTNTVRGEALYS
ncbi:hypothetical protein F4802DRAFT_591597 [Xylaria palmicola]|nr:hypothetical protein F4802DRAFT_591597 [Xylaria palmicola]